VALPTIAGADDAELARRAEATGRPLADVRNGTNIVGTPEQIAEKVGRLRDLGADRVHFQLMDLRDVDHVEFLGDQVLPLLR
jgi:alkanesulfonate monooxygenase SsuD/methylene tetrahydromethanopterin reductase-like flavin-dependent oxidoreductase (luciferase family)